MWKGFWIRMLFHWFALTLNTIYMFKTFDIESSVILDTFKEICILCLGIMWKNINFLWVYVAYKLFCTFSLYHQKIVLCVKLMQIFMPVFISFFYYRSEKVLRCNIIFLKSNFSYATVKFGVDPTTARHTGTVVQGCEFLQIWSMWLCWCNMYFKPSENISPRFT